MRVPLFSWFPHFWKKNYAKIVTFSFIFHLLLVFLPNFTLFFPHLSLMTSHTPVQDSLIVKSWMQYQTTPGLNSTRFFIFLSLTYTCQFQFYLFTSEDVTNISMVHFNSDLRIDCSSGKEYYIIWKIRPCTFKYISLHVILLLFIAGSKKGEMTGKLKDPPPYEGTEVSQTKQMFREIYTHRVT